MMQATTSLSLTLLMTCFPVWFRFLTASPYLTHGKFPLTREITRASSYAKMAGPRTEGLTYGYTWHVTALEGNITKG
jgi:hypothetical protein